MRIIFILAIATALSAQTFEVASVKRSAPEAEAGSRARSIGGVPRQQVPGRINYPNVRLDGVIALAYGVELNEINGPSWLQDERYDIVATMPAGTAQDRLPIMLQHLLAERFGMTVHEETKTRAGFALTVGKEAPRLTRSTETSRAGFVTRGDQVTYMKMTMLSFARLLSRYTGRPVTDETGIEGEYDLTLNASMSDLQAGSVSSAIQDLGLKLAPRTAPSRFIVIDKASKIPTGN